MAVVGHEMLLTGPEPLRCSIRQKGRLAVGLVEVSRSWLESPRTHNRLAGQAMAVSECSHRPGICPERGPPAGLDVRSNSPRSSTARHRFRAGHDTPGMAYPEPAGATRSITTGADHVRW